MKKTTTIIIALFLMLSFGLTVMPKTSEAGFTIGIGLGGGNYNQGYPGYGTGYRNGYSGGYGNNNYGPYTGYNSYGGMGYPIPYNAPGNTPYYHGFNPYTGGYPDYSTRYMYGNQYSGGYNNYNRPCMTIFC